MVQFAGGLAGGRAGERAAARAPRGAGGGAVRGARAAAAGRAAAAPAAPGAALRDTRERSPSAIYTFHCMSFILEIEVSLAPARLVIVLHFT